VGAALTRISWDSLDLRCLFFLFLFLFLHEDCATPYFDRRILRHVLRANKVEGV
jgi:hypothetical protein